MDQILSIVALLGRVDWISAVMTGVSVAVVSGFATAFARGFEFEGWRYTAAWILIFAIGIWPVKSGAKTYIAPSIYEWTHEDSLVRELSSAPLFNALLEHHPEARKPLVRAAIKVKWGRRETLVAATEFNALISHYLALDLPRTSDAVAKEFAVAIVGLFHHMINQDPELCVHVLYGSSGNQRDSITRFSHLSRMVMDRFGQVGGSVIRDAALNPSLVPDEARMNALRERVLQRMVDDGNPIATDPDQAMSDPQRACFAAMASYETAWKVVPEDEFGAFLRTTLALFFVDDEI